MKTFFKWVLGILALCFVLGMLVATFLMACGAITSKDKGCGCDKDRS